DAVADVDGAVGDHVRTPSDGTARTDADHGLGAQIVAGPHAGGQGDVPAQDRVRADLDPGFSVQGRGGKSDRRPLPEGREPARGAAVRTDLGAAPRVRPEGATDPRHQPPHTDPLELPASNTVANISSRTSMRCFALCARTGCRTPLGSARHASLTCTDNTEKEPPPRSRLEF